MAKIRDYAVTINATAGTSMVCVMPTHEIGDLLLAFVSKDAAAAFTAPGGWTNVQSSISAGAAGGIYALRATTTTTAATFTLASAANMAVMVAIKNVNGTTVADAISASSATAADAAGPTFPSGTLTPLHTSTLVFSSFYTDIGVGIGPNTGWVNVFSGDTGLNSLGVAYTYSTSTAAVTGTVFGSAAVLTGADGRGFMIAVRDNGLNSDIDPYVPKSTTPTQLLTIFSGQSGAAASDLGTWIAGNSRIFANIGPKATISANALNITGVGDTGYNPFRSTAQTGGSQSITQLGHTEFTPNTAFNLTLLKGLVFGTFRFTAPRDYVDAGRASEGGIYFAIGNGTATTAYAARAWVVGGQFSVTTKAANRQNFVIQVNQTQDTSYGFTSAGGTALTTSSIARVAIGSSSYYGAVSNQWNELYLLNEIQLVGGNKTFPMSISTYVNAVNAGCGNIPLIETNGSALTLWAPLRFGGVSNLESFAISVDQTTFQYPRQADEVNYLDWHVDQDYVGIEFYGFGANDSLVFTNCLFTSPTSYYWRFNAAHSTATTIDFSGSSVIKANIGLQSTVSLNDVTFTNCKEILVNGATLNECSILATSAIATQGAITISGSTQSALQTALNKLTNITYHDNITSSGALKINYTTSTTGTVTLSMTSGDFNNNTKDIYWVASTGTNLTINTSGTANPTTWTATNANIVSITITRSFVVTNIIDGTELRIFKQSDLTELAGAEIVGATPSGVNNLNIQNDTVNLGRYKATYSYNFANLGTSTLAIYVVALAKQYQWLRSNAALTDADGSLQISQLLDRQYNAGSIP